MVAHQWRQLKLKEQRSKSSHNCSSNFNLASKTLRLYTFYINHSHSPLQPLYPTTRDQVVNPSFVNIDLLTVYRAVFKWLSKVIATLSDWLRLAPVFQPMRSKTKTNRAMYAWFFPRFGRVTGKVIARNCDWFMELFVPVVIGRSFGFSTVNLKPL